jgi:hypothetical protein
MNLKCLNIGVFPLEKCCKKYFEIFVEKLTGEIEKK